MKKTKHLAPEIKLQLGEIEISLMKSIDVSMEYVSWLNDKNHLRFSNQRFQNHSLESCVKYVKSFTGSPNLLFKILLKGQFVGTSALEIDSSNKVGVLGMLISPQIKNQGVGKKAWNAIVHEISPTLGLRKLKAGVAEENYPMKRIILSSGMTLEGVLMRDLIIDGQESDLELYRIFL